MMRQPYLPQCYCADTPAQPQNPFSELTTNIKNTITPDSAKGALYIGLIGMLLSDIIPTPADGLYFLYEKNIRDRWTAGTLSPKQYWARSAIAYYGFNALWWASVILATASIKGGIKRKLTLAGGLVGSGAVVAVIFRNIKKDTASKAKSVTYGATTEPLPHHLAEPQEFIEKGYGPFVPGKPATFDSIKEGDIILEEKPYKDAGGAPRTYNTVMRVVEKVGPNSGATDVIYTRYVNPYNTTDDWAFTESRYFHDHGLVKGDLKLYLPEDIQQAEIVMASDKKYEIVILGRSSASHLAISGSDKTVCGKKITQKAMTPYGEVSLEQADDVSCRICRKYQDATL